MQKIRMTTQVETIKIEEATQIAKAQDKQIQHYTISKEQKKKLV